MTKSLYKSSQYQTQLVLKWLEIWTILQANIWIPNMFGIQMPTSFSSCLKQTNLWSYWSLISPKSGNSYLIIPASVCLSVCLSVCWCNCSICLHVFLCVWLLMVSACLFVLSARYLSWANVCSFLPFSYPSLNLSVCLYVLSCLLVQLYVV